MKLFDLLSATWAGAVVAVAVCLGAKTPTLAAENKTPRLLVLRAQGDTENLNADRQQKRVVIENFEPAEESAGNSGQDVAWLGVATEESSETLGAQLGLNPGEGLVVTYVASESPAAKAGLQKNDVLVEFEGQSLVHPAQLRKLVQVRKEGDTVKLTFYRGGKRDKVAVTLGKTKLGLGLLLDDGTLQGHLKELKRHLGELQVGDKVRDEMKRVQEELARAGIDKKSIEIEVKRSVEQAQKAFQEALRQATNAHHTIDPAIRHMREMVRRGVDVDKDATIVVKSRKNEVKTIVKTDDSGTYVIVADPRKHLTARDKAGKLAFEGEIETPQQQDSVPKEIWRKVQPMLEDLSNEKPEEPEAEPEKDGA